MDLRGDITSRFVRILAIVTLLVGLADAARLLGVGAGEVSPIARFGVAGFTYLAAFCLARLCAAVGMWIGASWGLVLVGGASVIEVMMFVTGSPDVHLDAIGFGVRLILLAGVGLIGFLWLRSRRVHD